MASRVEQQATGDGEREPCVGTCIGLVDAGRPAQRGHRFEPGQDEVVEQWLHRRVALQRHADHLEEQSLLRLRGGVDPVRPHGADSLRGAAVDRRVAPGRERLELGALVRLDVSHHLGEESGLRAEVVHEHAMAGADRGGEVAEAEPGNACPREVVDHLCEQLSSCVGSGTGHRPAL